MVAELLVKVELARHGDFIAALQERFFCPPFDLRCSSLAAELWQFHAGLSKADRLERNVLKADVMIIATAKVAGASVFYSHDGRCRKLAEKTRMRAEDLPSHHPDMYRDAEVAKQFASG